MNMNPELLERKDHGHYPACLGRMSAIKNYCNRLFFCTLIIGSVLFMISLTGIRLCVISWIPSLFGGERDLAPYFLRLLSCLMFIVLACLGWGRFKICNIILTCIYFIMTVAPVFVGQSLFDAVVLMAGVAGLLMSLRSFTYYRDYNQLRETEGFPHFNQRYIEQVEFSEYRSQHMKRYEQHNEPATNTEPEGYPKSAYDVHKENYEKNTAGISDNSIPNNAADIQRNSYPDSAADIQNNTAAAKLASTAPRFAEMPELTIGSSSQVSAPSGRFTPKDTKFGTIADSTVKLKYKGGS